METVKKNDFIEIEFIARVKEGEIFDTNIQSELSKLNEKAEAKPLIVCVGQGMVVKGLDKFLEGKETGKKYIVELASNEGFGERRKDLVKLMPLNSFTEKNVTPQAGMTLALDNILVKIMSVSGGRVLADFNHPLAGKTLIYEFTIKKKLDNIEEKVKALNEFFLRIPAKFQIDKEKKKVIFEDKNLKSVINMLKSNYKEILGYDIYV